MQATHSIRQFPLHLPPPLAAPCAITFQLDSTVVRGLQHGRFRVRLPVGERDVFLLQNVQTGSRVHPASYSMGTGVPSAGTAPTFITNTWSYTSITCMPSWYGRGKKNFTSFTSAHSFSLPSVELRNNLIICVKRKTQKKTVT